MTAPLALPMDPDQVPLFDLTGLTVKVPGQEQQEALDAAGASPRSRKMAYEDATIRQIVTYWKGEHYVEILERLNAAAAYFGTHNHTDTVEALLDVFELEHPQLT